MFGFGLKYSVPNSKFSVPNNEINLDPNLETNLIFPVQKNEIFLSEKWGLRNPKNDHCSGPE